MGYYDISTYLKPPGHDIDRNAPFDVLTDTGNLLRCYRWIPGTRQQCRDYVDLFRGMKYCLRE